MAAWRWFSCAVMFAAFLAFTGSILPVVAQEKDKGKDKTEKPAEKTEKPVTTGEKFKFAFKAFDPGAPVFYQTQTTTTTQKMKVMNQEVIQKQAQTFYISWTPKSEKDKDLVVVQKIIGVKLNIDIGGNKIAYDSTNEDQQKQNNPMTDFFNALKKLELTFTLDPKTKAIKKVDGRQELIKNLSESTPPMKALLDNILSDEAIKQMAQPTWGALPKDDEAAVGSTWSSEELKLNLGAIGTYNTSFTYKLDSVDGKEDGKKKAKISVTPSLTYKAPDAKAGSQLPFEIKEKSTLVSDPAGSKGEIIFDQAAGRFSSFSTITMKLKGNLIISVGNVETAVEMDQDQTSIATFSDTNPIAPATKK